jgi:hypothetical protein
MRFFLKSIDYWSIVGSGWTKPEDATPETVPLKNARLSNDKALHALCQALSPSEFAKTSIKESKDLEEMKIEELVGSLQTYELSLPPVKKLKTIALKASKKKIEASYENDSEDEDKAVPMLAKKFRRLTKDDRFKKKFSDKIKKPIREAGPEEEEKRDPRGPRCFECLGFWHIRADCGNLKKDKGEGIQCDSQ